MEAAGAGEVEAINEIDEFGRWLAVGLGNLMATLDPDVVVLGGGVMDSADPLVRAAERHLADRQGVLRVTGLPPIRPAWFGSLAGLVGAALAAEEMTR
jgi:glucokinase